MCTTTPTTVRPASSPRKRKFSDAAEAASPTLLDQMARRSTSQSLLLEERRISPKKKVRSEERNLSKLESHVLTTIANALDLGSMDDSEDCEPIAFSAIPAGDLVSDELEILRHFLA